MDLETTFDFKRRHSGGLRQIKAPNGWAHRCFAAMDQRLLLLACRALAETRAQVALKATDQTIEQLTEKINPAIVEIEARSWTFDRYTGVLNRPAIP